VKMECDTLGKGWELAAHWLHVVCHSILSGQRKHSGKLFKSKIYPTCQVHLNRDLFFRRYGPPLNMAFSKWPSSQINCLPLC